MRNRIVRGVAGSFILISLILAIYVNINWLWFNCICGGQPIAVLNDKMVPARGHSQKIWGQQLERAIKI